MSKKHLLHNHQSSHARPDEQMGHLQPDWRDNKTIGSNVKQKPYATPLQRYYLKHTATKKRRQRDFERITDPTLAAHLRAVEEVYGWACWSVNHNDPNGCANPECWKNGRLNDRPPKPPPPPKDREVG